MQTCLCHVFASGKLSYCILEQSVNTNLVTYYNCISVYVSSRTGFVTGLRETGRTVRDLLVSHWRLPVLREVSTVGCGLM